MQVVTAQLSERVEHLMDLSAPAPAEPVMRTARAVPAEPEPAQVDPSTQLKAQAADTLREVAMLLNTVEVHGMRGRGRGGQRPDQTGQGASRGDSGPTPSPASAPWAPAPPQPTTPPSLMASPPPPPRSHGGDPSSSRANSNRDSRGFRPPADSSSVPPSESSGSFRGGPGPQPVPPAGSPDAAGTPDESDRIRIDVGPIAREVFRQFVPEGTNPNDLTPEQRQRVAAEINQRMMGINEGIKLAAAELQRKAEAAQRVADENAKAAQATAAAAQAKAAAERTKVAAQRKKADAAKGAPGTTNVAAEATKGATTSTSAAASTMKRKTALSGNHLDVTVEQNGQVVRAVNAEINLPNVLMTVFSSMPRGQGEVPFAVGKDARIYTPTDADRRTIEELSPASRPDGASMLGEWVVVITKDPTGSGLRLGIASPVGNSLNELRHTAGRNAALGLLFIGLAIGGIVPLSGRLTRNLSTLTEGVKRIAHGDYSTRVQLTSKDEIGQLAGAFNQMAADVEEHQRAVVEQERIRHELALGRQIQHDMQPHEPLRLGLTEIQGVSVPAREVGGDFFNYFALPNGQVALLVGDVSGKGVGAALLMANIQASLRTRFALGQDLSAIADAIDRDIESNSPGQMYATLFMGILDPAKRRLRYVNAGHNPQFVLRNAGGLDRLGATGLPVGLLSGRGYAEREVQLGAGDLIYFYTDGCVETENEAGDMFGAEKLEAVLVASHVQSPNDVLQNVERGLKAFRGKAEPFDDATMMAVRVG
jgi:serine phosphatase RsbU (regulator of sigma subunit)